MARSIGVAVCTAASDESAAGQEAGAKKRAKHTLEPGGRVMNSLNELEWCRGCGELISTLRPVAGLTKMLSRGTRLRLALASDWSRCVRSSVRAVVSSALLSAEEGEGCAVGAEEAEVEEEEEAEEEEEEAVEFISDKMDKEDEAVVEVPAIAASSAAKSLVRVEFGSSVVAVRGGAREKGLSLGCKSGE
jgi:hypothetical protein